MRLKQHSLLCLSLYHYCLKFWNFGNLFYTYFWKIRQRTRTFAVWVPIFVHMVSTNSRIKLPSIKLYLRMGKWDRKNISPQPYIYEVVKVHLSGNVSAMPLSICSTQSSPNNIERSSIEKKLCRDCKYPSIPLDSTPSAPHDGVIEPTLNSPLFHHVHSLIHPQFAHLRRLSWMYGDMLRRDPSVYLPVLKGLEGFRGFHP